MTQPKLPRLENWFLITIGTDKCLAGYVYNDPRYHKESKEFSDGHRVITSPIQSLDKTDKLGKTENTSYLLGKELVLEKELVLSNLTHKSYACLDEEFNKVLPRISHV